MLLWGSEVQVTIASRHVWNELNNLTKFYRLEMNTLNIDCAKPRVWGTWSSYFSDGFLHVLLFDWFRDKVHRFCLDKSASSYEIIIFQKVVNVSGELFKFISLRSWVKCLIFWSNQWFFTKCFRCNYLKKILVILIQWTINHWLQIVVLCWTKLFNDVSMAHKTKIR